MKWSDIRRQGEKRLGNGENERNGQREGGSKGQRDRGLA